MCKNHIKCSNSGVYCICKLVNFINNVSEVIKVADIKVSILTNFLEVFELCDKIEEVILFGSVLETRCRESSDIDMAIIVSECKSRLWK